MKLGYCLNKGVGRELSQYVFWVEKRQKRENLEERKEKTS